ncbi:MAG TPA: ATPase P [Anaeromyxobacteraceae bacterium]|nr:ATPase P [Anaeromyxobacteraceae bacterium]
MRRACVGPRRGGGIRVEIPGRRTLVLRCLVLDMNGTIATDGEVLPGVGGRVARLSRALDVVVLTADTYGTAARALAGLPLRLHRISTGDDKAAFVASGRGVAAVGNGANDVAMLRAADLGIAVLGREGTAAALLGAADVVVTRIEDALDLLLDPRRLVATLRR